MRIFTNHFQIRLPSPPEFSTFEMRFEPTLLSVKEKKFLMYSSPKIPNILTDGIYVYAPNVTEESQDIPCFSRAGVCLRALLTKTDNVPKPSPVIILNMIIERSLFLLCNSYKKVGNCFFDKSRSVEFKEFEIWPGYSFSYCELNDVKNMIVSQKSLVFDKETTLSIITIDKNALEKGTTLINDYDDNLYILDHIDFDKNPSSPNDNGSTLEEELFVFHSRRILDKTQPLLACYVSGLSKITYLAPETCHVVDESGGWLPFEMKEYIRNYIKPKAEDVCEAILTLMDSLNGISSIRNLFDEWCISVDSQPLSFTTRELDPIQLVFSSEQDAPVSCVSEKWEKMIFQNGVYQPKPLTNWIIITIDDKNKIENAKKLIAMLAENSQNLAKISVDYPMCDVSADDSVAAYIDVSNNCVKNAGNVLIDQVLLIIDREDGSRYDDVWRLFNNVGATVHFLSESALTKILSENESMHPLCQLIREMNVKRGGASWTIETSAPRSIFLAISVVSVSATEEVVTCVSSLNNVSNWISQCKRQAFNMRGKLLDHFAKKALKAYFDLNNEILPDNVVIYGNKKEGLDMHDQCDSLEKAITCVYGMKKLPPAPLCFIAICPMGTRAFASNGSEKFFVPPGIAITHCDLRDGTKIRSFDIFIREGGSPTHYEIIVDKTNFAEKHINIAYELCHMNEATCVVCDVPAPVFYANRLAEKRMKCDFVNHDRLRNALYYI